MLEVFAALADKELKFVEDCSEVLGECLGVHLRLLEGSWEDAEAFPAALFNFLEVWGLKLVEALFEAFLKRTLQVLVLGKTHAVWSALQGIIHHSIS